MKPRRIRAAIAVLLALLQPLGAAPSWSRPPDRARAPHPALWVVHGRQGTVWLFGTIHALPPHFEWENGAIHAAIAGSDRLVIEAVIDQAKDAGALLTLGTATTPLPPITERVAPRLRPALAAMVAKSAVPAATLDRMKTWAAAMVLFGVTVSNLGVTSSQGVEEQLKTEFHDAGKPVEGLETLAQQLGFFDTLDEARQREFLASVVDEKHDDAADFGKMLAAWARGDERGISASFDKEMKANDTLRTVLLARRNAHWADALVKRLAMPGTQFVAVGAGHLTGADSVQAMLARLGYKAKRVQ
ncbi:MAG TPA: TraB/GumN family protein [Sphingomonas sp.]